MTGTPMIKINSSMIDDFSQPIKAESSKNTYLKVNADNKVVFKTTEEVLAELGTSGLDQSIEELDAKIDNVNTALTEKIDTNKTNTDNTIQELTNKHNAEITNLQSSLGTRIDDLEDNTDDKLFELKNYVNEQDNTLSTKIDTSVETLNGTINDKETSLNQTITSNTETINKRIDDEVQVLNTSIGTKIDVSVANEALNKKADKSDTYTKSEVDAIVASAFHYKGSVDTYESLPKEGNQIGDVWNINENGANYAWTGEIWDKLSETIDLSVYYTKSEANTLLNDKVSTASFADALELKSDKTNTYTKQEVNDIIATKIDTIALEEKLALKADKATTYTKDDVNGLLNDKVSISLFDESLALKANQETTYTKQEVNDLLNEKISSGTKLSDYGIQDAYTKDEVNEALALKADTATLEAKVKELEDMITNRVVGIIRIWNKS